MRAPADSPITGAQIDDFAGGERAGAEPAAEAGAQAARPATPRVPDFLIAGHPKCGTTALFHMLREHPQIYMPLKEPRFFVGDSRSRFKRLGANTLPVTLEQYLGLFAPARADQICGEASPQYLRSSTAAQRIADVAPEARIIAVLREPASFLRSFHLQSLHNHNETEPDFAKALALEGPRREGRKIPRLTQSPEALFYSEHVRYVEQLRRFEDALGAENMLVLIYEDFRRDNDATTRRVLRFLGVDDTVAIAPVQTERLPAVRSQHMHQLVFASTILRRRLRRGRPSNGTPRWQRMLRRAAYTEQSPPQDEQLMLQLRRRFAPEVSALGEYLGRDLVTEWGYDRLD